MCCITNLNFVKKNQTTISQSRLYLLNLNSTNLVGSKMTTTTTNVIISITVTPDYVNVTAIATLFRVIILLDATAANAMSACLQPDTHNSYSTCYGLMQPNNCNIS